MISQLQFNNPGGPPAGAAYGSCFNSVKKRQLERLQKRSDWFLSPPAGLRSSGMMRVDPPPTPGAFISSNKIAIYLFDHYSSLSCITSTLPSIGLMWVHGERGIAQ